MITTGTPMPADVVVKRKRSQCTNIIKITLLAGRSFILQKTIKQHFINGKIKTNDDSDDNSEDNKYKSSYSSNNNSKTRA